MTSEFTLYYVKEHSEYWDIPLESPGNIMPESASQLLVKL